MNIIFILNGEDVSARAEPLMRLSDMLRDTFGLASLMSDCHSGVCGKCVVLLDGRLVNSCLVPAFRARGAEVVSYEGFSSTDDCETVKAAFAANGVELCGFCDPAVHMAAGSLLYAAGRKPEARPSDEEIADIMSSVYCRCHVPRAILKAARAAVDSRFGGAYDRAR